jgi:hypothetical protein
MPSQQRRPWIKVPWDDLPARLRSARAAVDPTTPVVR